MDSLASEIPSVPLPVVIVLVVAVFLIALAAAVAVMAMLTGGGNAAPSDSASRPETQVGDIGDAAMYNGVFGHAGITDAQATSMPLWRGFPDTDATSAVCGSHDASTSGNWFASNDGGFNDGHGGGDDD